jgi:hypothetical protein
MDKDSLERRTTDVGRVYFDSNSDKNYPSVTTVLNVMETPEGLKKWKQKNKGKNNRHWKDIMEYKGYRGTLLHYELLNPLAKEELYGENENTAEENLEEENVWKRTDFEVEEDPVERTQEGIEFAKNVWSDIKEQRGITDENILNVETFVVNSDLEYAGQFDLFYLDKEGDVTLCDLKTSSGVYDKHKLQTIAYNEAVDVDVDKLEVIRIHPDREEYEISHDSDWDKSREAYKRQLEYLRAKAKMEMDEEKLDKIANEGVDDG